MSVLRHSLFPTVALVLLCAAPLRAQSATQQDPFGAGPDTSSVPYGPEPLVTPKTFTAPVTGHPLEVTRYETFDPLPGVPPLDRVWVRRIFRDTQGRERIEMKTGNYAPWVRLTDPVAHKLYYWNECNCEVQTADLPATYRERKPLPAYTPADMQTLDGHQVIYSRREAAGDPSYVTETWYDPQLMWTVKRIIHDPKRGTYTYTWTHFKTGEPKASLFVPPHSK